MENAKKKLILQNKAVFYGKSFGADCDVIAPLVMNNAMVGYQEIITDPVYYGKAVMMTYPVIGNYGITDEDNESKQLTVSALIVRDYNDMPSNFRYTKTLAETLCDSGIPGIYGIDTRQITNILRNEGNMLCMIVAEDFPNEDALLAMNYYTVHTNLIKTVGCRKKWYSRTYNPKFNIVAIDCGVKFSSVKALGAGGCDVTVVPYDTPFEDIMSLKPDGIFVSGGPEDIGDLTAVAETFGSIKGKVPILATGNGAVAAALSYGCEVYAMKTGHNGCNHSVTDTENGTLSVEYQTHTYCVTKEELDKAGLKVTFENGLDRTVEGFTDKSNNVFASFFIPDGVYDPTKSDNMYGRFICAVKEVKKNA